MKRAKLDKAHNKKKAKLDKTDTHSAAVAPQDVELEEEADDIDVVEVDVKVDGEEDRVKMERERWSEVWNYYTRLPIGTDGRERAECDKCKKRYICETKNGTGDKELYLQDLTEDVMKLDSNANGTHEEMESQA
ncbi:unnamed protein product [Lactuca virosa]|uniref:BED-type domain-containing protein n=1 Tax=Lactuca virosa TaxID=75947 RepID=A0AAU9PT64_9ASTR|nr:unnamed protein product [Lactuca virosa]